MFRLFYSKTVVLNKKRLHFKNACIAVSNHPSTLTDPLHVAKEIRKQVFFLANAGLFKSKFGSWFFNTFYCIPVERPQDASGRKIQNEDAFARCDEHLSKDGCLYIAPQGLSQMVRRLGHPVKTGTARIALSAESKNDFNLGLTLLPVGLTYTRPTDFRSQVIINPGEHIIVANYQSAYANNPSHAVKLLTKDLEDQLRALLIDAENEEEELLIQRMETILNSKNPLPLEQNFLRTQKLIQQLQQLKKSYPNKYQILEDKTTHHFEQLEQAGIKPESIFAKAAPFASLPGLILGLPFFLYGWINNFLPNFLPALLAKKLNLYIGYTPTVKLMSSLLIYPVFYGLQIMLVQYFFANKWLTLAYIISLPILGLLALAYCKNYIRFKELTHWKKKRKEQPGLTNGILNDQTLLADELNQLIS